MSTSKDRRDCPVAGKQIAAAECGESRHSRYACPEDCPHNTFAPSNYKRLLEVAEKSDRLMFERFGTQPAVAAQIGRELRSLQETGRQDRAGMLIMDWFHFRRDAEGLSFFERWEEQGFPRLRNDQRVFLTRRAGLRPSLIEVRQIVDSEQMVAVDLLEPEAGEFLLLDRSLASRAVRFSTWLAWTYDLPHGRLLHGAMFEVDPIHDLGPAEVLEILLDHLGCPKSAAERRRWMLEGFMKVKETMDAAIQLRRRIGMESMDTRPREVLYRHGLDMDDFAELLETHPQLVFSEYLSEGPSDDSEEAWDWTDAADATKPLARVMGRVVLGRRKCRLEALDGRRITQMREDFERYMGPRVEFEEERTGESMLPKLPPLDPDLRAKVPPRLLENPPILSTESVRVGKGMVDAAGLERDVPMALLRAWLNEPVPALRGMTPREAAVDLDLRPRLVQLVKDRVRDFDRMNLNEGTTRDMNWVLRDLGLDEWIYPPPPPRPRPVERDNPQDN